MTKQDLIRFIDELDHTYVKHDIYIDKLVKAEYVVGCYYDEEDQLYKVYSGEERTGTPLINFETKSHSDAYNQLFSYIFSDYSLEKWLVEKRKSKMNNL